jgi:hypothetical protein
MLGDARLQSVSEENNQRALNYRRYSAGMAVKSVKASSFRVNTDILLRVGVINMGYLGKMCDI